MDRAPVHCPTCSSLYIYNLTSSKWICDSCKQAFQFTQVNIPPSAATGKPSKLRSIYDKTRMILGLFTVLTIAVFLAYHYTYNYAYKIPIVGPNIQNTMIPEPDHPTWVADYTDNMDVIYRYTWHQGLDKCLTGAYYTLQSDREALGLHLEPGNSTKGAICVREGMSIDTPTCTNLHELAHAIHHAEEGYTDHKDRFRTIFLQLINQKGDN